MKKKKTLATRADKYDLYLRSVQNPEFDVSLVKRVFKRHFNRRPRDFREDFCGTAAIATTWVATHRKNKALAVDIDPEPLEWGRNQHIALLKKEERSRLKLVEGDVRLVRSPKVDVTMALNFSYFIFKNRTDLLGYFRSARASLKEQGIFILDVYGGPDAQTEMEESRRIDDFWYEFEQYRFDPIHNHTTNFIHFEFKDGSRMERAFRYDWRLWSIPELRDLLAEAGFRTSEVYWENSDKGSDEGNGVYTVRKRADDDPSWVAFIAAVK